MSEVIIMDSTMISIHAPREGSDPKIPRRRCCHTISIHAPREGSDGTRRFRRPASIPFLSTLPARGATDLRPTGGPNYKISIHAPREGSDIITQ